LSRTNTLAYYKNSKNTDVKSFITFAPEPNSRSSSSRSDADSGKIPESNSRSDRQNLESPPGPARNSASVGKREDSSQLRNSKPPVYLIMIIYYPEKQSNASLQWRIQQNKLECLTLFSILDWSKNCK